MSRKQTARLVATSGVYQISSILRTARTLDGDHAGTLRRYKSMVGNWLEQAV